MNQCYVLSYKLLVWQISTTDQSEPVSFRLIDFTLHLDRRGVLVLAITSPQQAKSDDAKVVIIVAAKQTIPNIPKGENLKKDATNNCKPRVHDLPDARDWLSNCL